MKLSGTPALYAQLKEHENIVAITKKQIALAEELSGETAPAKKTRRKRTPKVNGFDQADAERHTAEVKRQFASATDLLAKHGD